MGGQVVDQQGHRQHDEGAGGHGHQGIEVAQVGHLGAEFGQESPALSPEYPDYPAYARLTPMDRMVFLRRLIPRAVTCFRDQVEPVSPE
jgi:hypothetical protein